jgi:hypothetical protein
MRLLITLTILTICLTALAQTSPTKKSVYVDTEVKYTDSAGKGVVIQNSLPKGGGGYIHSSGKTFSYVIFWTRVINQTTTPLELSIHFPADSLTIFPSPDSYLKVFLPPDTMTINKESLYDYGLTGLKSFLDTAFGKPTMLHRIINPKEECLFYIGMLFYQARGTARSELVLKDQHLFYRIKIGSQPGLIPCGLIVFKN